MNEVKKPRGSDFITLPLFSGLSFLPPSILSFVLFSSVFLSLSPSGSEQVSDFSDMDVQGGRGCQTWPSTPQRPKIKASLVELLVSDGMEANWRLTSRTHLHGAKANVS